MVEENLTDLLGAIYVQLTRIYDILAVVHANDEGVQKLLELHEAGQIVTPDPYLSGES
jgi:hypothetical protein